MLDTQMPRNSQRDAEDVSVIDEIRNPPSGCGTTMNESTRQSLLFWRTLAEKAADELEQKDKELERYESVVDAAKAVIENSGYGHHEINLNYIEYAALKVALNQLTGD